MRFFSVFVLLSLACLAFGEDQMVVSSTVAPGPLSRLFFWFRRPGEKQVVGQFASTADSSNRKDVFSDPMPQESTDRMINDALGQHILKESQEQQVTGNAFIEDHQSSASDSNSEQVAPNRDGYGKSTNDKPDDVIPLTEALRIVNTAKLTDCVARVICELSCNANAYGNPGRMVFRNMIKIQFDQTIKGPDVKFFRQSAAKG